MSELVFELLADRHDLEDFTSGTLDLDRWLQRSARTAAAAGTAATYVALDGDRVVGYYAIAMGSVAHETAPSRLRRGMPDPVPVVLLARLAVGTASQGRGWGGRVLVDAMRRAARGGREFGARAIVVDAIDQTAYNFYQHFGFLPLEGNRLWRRLSVIAREIRAEA